VSDQVSCEQLLVSEQLGS